MAGGGRWQSCSGTQEMRQGGFIGPVARRGGFSSPSWPTGGSSMGAEAVATCGAPAANGGWRCQCFRPPNLPRGYPR
jgi:hypothetical protein